MPKAFWIGAYSEIRDTDKLQAYAVLAKPAVEKHGGVFVARGGDSRCFEGGEKARIVVVEFPSLEAAETCYNSPEYQEAHDKLGDGADRDLFVVEAAE